ncbi:MULTISPECIES: sll1863 family stress response protein [Fulvivirga]|uniref:Lipoprotein n=1 Tax=Fulvivirga sediminis TaxID=2803949 RepID=A0A937FB00_9BACT|nr:MULTISPECIES: hypothetical protein [Fulvivirga]MBL3657168.1 hypothetical protein [Fulvivirga sediminis]UII27606.1 hypothetical protein LVD15_04040 [Fulvivirga maritima]
MKRSLMSVFILSGLLCTVLSGCTPATDEPSKDIELIDQNPEEDMIQAKDDYLTEIEQYKAEMSSKIDENERVISAYKDSVDTGPRFNKMEYKVEINHLETKNNELKDRLNDYETDGESDDWQTFKSEFNHDMDEMGTSFKNLFERNVE